MKNSGSAKTLVQPKHYASSEKLNHVLVVVFCQHGHQLFNKAIMLRYIYLLTLGLHMQDVCSSSAQKKILAGTCASLGIAGSYWYMRHITHHLRCITVPHIIELESERILRENDMVSSGRRDAIFTTYDQLLQGVRGIQNSLQAPTQNISRFNRVLFHLLYSPEKLRSGINEACARKTVRYINAFFDKRLDRLKGINSDLPQPMVHCDSVYYNEQTGRSKIDDLQITMGQTFPSVRANYVCDAFVQHTEKCKEYSQEATFLDKSILLVEWMLNNGRKLYGSRGLARHPHPDDIYEDALRQEIISFMREKS